MTLTRRCNGMVIAGWRQDRIPQRAARAEGGNGTADSCVAAHVHCVLSMTQFPSALQKMGVGGIIIASVTGALSGITTVVIMRSLLAPRRSRRSPDVNKLSARNIGALNVNHEGSGPRTEATSFSREPGEYTAGAEGTRHVHTDPSP